MNAKQLVDKLLEDRPDHRLLVLYDATGDGTTSTAVGTWVSPDGEVLKDNAVIEYWDTDNIDQNPSGVAEFQELGDAKVLKFGDWQVTSDDVSNLAKAHLSFAHDKDDVGNDINVVQARAVLSMLSLIVDELNKVRDSE